MAHYKRIKVARREKATFLNLSNLGLHTLPKELFKITNIEGLDLRKNSLSSIPFEIAQLINLKRLYLGSNSLNTLPESMRQLKKLNVLDLSLNNFTELPRVIGELSKLHRLDLRNNLLSSIPEEISKLPTLTRLFLNSNKLEELPFWLFDFEKIININLGEDQIWTAKTLYLENNPIVDPPVEILEQGLEAVKNYFIQITDKKTERLFEAKLIIVGEPGAGKTTLANKILDEDYELDENEKSTEGIDIIPYRFSGNEGDFKINIWDFGGQEIYKSTHQFFLTKRSLYVLLEDSREEKTDFNYWLQVIELLSENSPVIIVQNEKQDRKRSINEAGLRGRFRNLLKVFQTNLLTKRGLQNLINSIKFEIQQLPHIGVKLPKAWIDIRKELDLLAQTRFYIDLKKYYEVCKNNGLEGIDRAIFLSDYLHDLGVFLHFRNSPILKKTIILRPEWGTDAVYKVLDNTAVVNANGYFTKDDLQIIWKDIRYSDMYDELLALMMKFELCYQMEGATVYIAPQLLKGNQPEYNWNPNKNLFVRYEYDFMPKGLMTRFIVRMHRHIKDQNLVWKDGVILERDGAKAEVIETYGKRAIHLRVQGNYRKELLTLILNEFDEKIHAAFQNLKVEKLIPCNCTICKNDDIPYYFRFNFLRKALRNGEIEWKCERSFEKINILSLVDEIELAFGDTIQKDPKKIFLSYSREDEVFKKKLDLHFSSLKQNRRIEVWQDEKIMPGDDWAKTIRYNLESADIILLLVSANFMASEFCYSVEMKQALQRHKAGEAIVIPIIIKPCDWDETPLKKIQVLPKNGKPISTWENIDEAYYDIIVNVKQLL